MQNVSMATVKCIHVWRCLIMAEELWYLNSVLCLLAWKMISFIFCNAFWMLRLRYFNGILISLVSFLPCYCNTFLGFLWDCYISSMLQQGLFRIPLLLFVFGGGLMAEATDFLRSLPTKLGQDPVQYGLYTRLQSCACKSHCCHSSCHTH